MSRHKNRDDSRPNIVRMALNQRSYLDEHCQEVVMSAVDATVFAAIEAIESGEWDRYLHRLKGAVVMRQKTDDYKATLIAGDS